MYNQFFHLTKNPFSMTPDPMFLFLTAQHREAMAGITYAILARKGFLVLTGMAGTGKTTVARSVIERLPQSSARTSVILNPTLTASEFLEMAMMDFGIHDIPASKAQRLCSLQSFLLQAREANQVCALIVDEAHKLSPELLEEIRLLGNFERPDAKLLQILLIGQSELDDTLNSRELWQLKQRISVRLSIEPLSYEATEQYIAHRWAKAGGPTPTPFTTEAVAQIAALSKGIPRLVNSICDSALMLAFADSAQQVQLNHIHTVAKDLQLTTTLPSPKPHLLDRSAQEELTGSTSEPFTPVRLRTLECYASPPKGKLIARWAGRLGLA